MKARNGIQRESCIGPTKYTKLSFYTQNSTQKIVDSEKSDGGALPDLKRTIFRLERECTSSRTIGIRFEFILTTAQCITVLSVEKLLYQLLFKLSEIPVGMVRVVC